FTLSSLEYDYSSKLRKQGHQNYHSYRAHLNSRIYKSLYLPEIGITMTPYIGVQATAYENTPKNDSLLVATGHAGFDLRTSFMKSYTKTTHHIHPYCAYHYSTNPKNK